MKISLRSLPFLAAVFAVGMGLSAIPASASIVNINSVTEPGYGVVDLDAVGTADWWWIEDGSNTIAELAGGTIIDTSSLSFGLFTAAGGLKWNGQSPTGTTVGEDNHVQGPNGGLPITFDLTPDAIGTYTLDLYATANNGGQAVTGTFDGVASNTLTAGNLTGIQYTVNFDALAADVGTPVTVGIARAGTAGQIRLQGATLSFVPAAVVPEPSSVALLVGLGGLTVLRRRR